MSEDRPDDDAAAAPPPEPSSSPEPAAPEGAPDPTSSPSADASTPRGGRRRVLLLVAGLVLAIGALIVILAARRGHRDPGTTGGATKDGGAAIRAPEGPHLPGDPSGVNLTGFVVDGAGLPVEGAEVSAEAEQGAADRALAPVPRNGGGAGRGAGSGSGSGSGSASAPVSAAASGSGAGAAVVHVAAPTGADGRFVVGGLAPGRFRVRVHGKGLVPAEVRFVPVPSDATRIVVARQVSIEGLVTDSGRPAPNVQVGLRGDAIGGAIEMRSDASGKFVFADLPEGRYQLFAWHGALAARTVRVNRLGAGPFAPLELRLEAASIVIGRVIDRDEGTGLVAAIELRPSGDDQAPRYARSAEDGTFRIEGVPTGTWIADAFAPGYLSPGGVELEAGRGIPELALARAGTIEGRVLDGDGNPIAGASVRAIVGTGETSTEISEAIDQDKLRRFSGRMAAPVVSASSPVGADPQLIPRGELGILVGPIPPIPPPGAQVARPTSTDLTAPGVAGEPPPLPADPATASIWVTGGDGRFRVRGLGKGKVAILATAPGFAEGRSKQLSIDPGQLVTAIDVVLTPGTIILGKVTDQHRVPVTGAQITITPDVGVPLSAFTDESGEYRVGPITGTVALQASAYGHGDARRTLELPSPKGTTPAERREDLVLEVADAILAGTLDDTTGAPVAGAHIEVIGGAAEGRQATVAADGTFAIDMLPAGHLRVRVSHPDYPVKELDVLASTGGKERVRLRLAVGGAVEGAVIDGTSGSPLTSITITGAGPGGATIEGTSDKVGRWKLGPLEPGRWKLTVELPGYLPLAREIDVIAARTPGAISVRDIRLELARGALVGGTVRDARGRRINGAKITARLANDTGVTVEGASDSEGEFRLKDVPTGELIIRATTDELGGSTKVTVRPGDEVLGLSIDLR